MKSEKERLAECLACEFFETCFDTVQDPEEHENGSCKTKDILKERKSKWIQDPVEKNKILGGKESKDEIYD